jgi:hypothetical protein
MRPRRRRSFAFNPPRVPETAERREARQRDLATCAEAVNAPIGFALDPAGPVVPDSYVLQEQGKIVARWREADHPGFAAWLMVRLDERGAALRLARAQGQLTAKQSERGRQSGEARDPEAAHPDLAGLIRNALRRGEDPRTYVPEWAREYYISRSALYALIKRIEGASTT